MLILILIIHPLIKMRTLSDEQYQTLKDHASGRGMALYGYTNQGDGILLNNSVRNDVWGKTMPGLIKAINMATY